MNWTPRRERLRALLAGPRCVYPGSVLDPISARIAEDLGFEVGMFAGSVRSLWVRDHGGFFSPKLLQMILQLRDSFFGGRNVPLNSIEFGVARWIGFGTIDEERR